MQAFSETGDSWRDVTIPVSESNSYVQIERFLNKLSVQQLQDIYKRKEDLLAKI